MNGGLGIGDLSIGVSAQGAVDYYDNLHTDAIEKAIEAVQNLTEVNNVLESGWQGAAEANFEKNLNNGAQTVANELREIDKAIQSLITELVEDWAQQDETLVEVDDSIVSF